MNDERCDTCSAAEAKPNKGERVVQNEPNLVCFRAFTSLLFGQASNQSSDHHQFGRLGTVVRQANVTFDGSTLVLPEHQH
jgi:hypothetical protein